MKGIFIIESREEWYFAQRLCFECSLLVFYERCGHIDCFTADAANSFKKLRVCMYDGGTPVKLFGFEFGQTSAQLGSEEVAQLWAE
jgi:hypothetical protein